MNQNYSKRLWIICLEALNHELDGGIILQKRSVALTKSWEKGTHHICHGESTHVKYNALFKLVKILIYEWATYCCIYRRVEDHPRGLNQVDSVSFQTLFALFALSV